MKNIEEMTEHEKLQAICDKIWYKIWSWYETKWNNWYQIWVKCDYCNGWERIDSREIIFTPEFMNKYAKYFYDEFFWMWNEIALILDSLDNPVDYLYDLIF